MVTSRESGKETKSGNAPDAGAPSPSDSQSNKQMTDTQTMRAMSDTQTLRAMAAKRSKVFARLGIVGLVAAVIGIGIWFFIQGREETDDAYVDGHISNISSRVPGVISKVLVADNQLVTAGQPLVELDSNDYDVKVDQAEAAFEEANHQAQAQKSKIDQSTLTWQGMTHQANAGVASMQAQISSAESAVKQARADIKTAEMKVREEEAQVRFAQADFDRYKSVYEDHVVTKQQFDKAKEAFDIAQAQLQEAQDGLQSAHDREQQAKSQLVETQQRFKKSEGEVTTALATTHQEQVDREQYAGALAAIKIAEADLKAAKLNRSYCVIVAPVAGRIGRRAAEVGQHIEAGQLLMAVVQEQPWVTANYKETQIGKMHQGQPVEIKIDTFGGRAFKGYVDSVSPASGAKFSMLPPDNATGNFTKVVQRLPVKIIFDERSIQSVKDNISPGMSCVVTVITNKN